MFSFADDFWLLRYPLKHLGFDMQRNVSVVRLAQGNIAILSSGPFTPQDVAAIRDLGTPSWLVEGMLRHDTFSQQGHDAFPDLPFLAPPGFEAKVDFPIVPIIPVPPEWGSDLQAVELGGMPASRETLFFHAASRTLIVEDLLFNFPGKHSLRTRFLLRLAVGKQAPAVPRSVPLQVRDRAAFETALAQIFTWDFERIVVAHGEPIAQDGREILREALESAGFAVPDHAIAASRSISAEIRNSR